MDRNAKPFVPGRKVVIKNQAGQEINVEQFKKHGASGSISGFQSPVSAVPQSPARKPIRIETEEAKQARMAEEERQKKEKEAANTTKNEALGMRAELKNLLRQRVNVGVSEKYLTSGKVDIDELLRQKELGEGKTGEFLGGGNGGLGLEDL